MRSAWLKILIAVLVLAALGALAYRSRDAIHLANFSWSRLGGELAGARKEFLLAAVGAVYLAYFLRALRWRRFCRYLGTPSIGDIYGPTLMGFSSMFLLGRPAEPVRPLLLARRCKMAVSSMFGIYVLERLFDTAATAVLAGSSLLLFGGSLAAGEWEGRIRVAGGALLGGLLVFAAVLIYFQMHGAEFLQRRLAGWRTAGGWRGFAATQFSEFGDGLQAIRGLSDWWAAVAYSTLHWGLIVVIYVLVVRSFGGPLGQFSFRAAMLVLAVTMLGSLVQLPGVGGGAQLATFIALTQILGFEAEPSAAAAVMTWIISFAGSCLVGLPLLMREGLSMGELRRMATAETKAEIAGGHTTVQEIEAIAHGQDPPAGDGVQ